MSLSSNQSESRMREIRTSGLMSGEGRRTVYAAPRLSSTLLVRLPCFSARVFRRLVLDLKQSWYSGVAEGAANLDSSKLAQPSRTGGRQMTGLVR